jgi:peptidoglycan endopeptidase LytE
MQGFARRWVDRARGAATAQRSMGALLVAGAAAVGLVGGRAPAAAVEAPPAVVAWANAADRASDTDAPVAPATPPERAVADGPVVETPADDGRPLLSARGDRWEESPRPALPVLPTVFPTAAPTPRPPFTTYRVVAGDRVVDLAARFGVSPATIVRANGLADAEALAVDQELTIPAVSGRLHTVAEGDTILSLADRYGVIPEEIVAANRLTDADVIRPGQRLVMPMSPEQEQAAREAEAAPPKPLTPIVYTVAPGDTVLGLAARFGVSADSIRWANRFDDADVLSLGQQVTVPPVTGVLHGVAAGDTLVGVAARYQASASDIVRANGLADPFVIRPGDVLVVPGGVPAGPLPAPAASAAPRPPPAQADARPAPASAAAPVRPAAPVPAAPVALPAGPPNGGVVSIAMGQLGAPYVFGGTTPAGFDCSGFVMWAYRRAGTPIPRDMWGQLRSGPRIARGDLQVGDVVFFQNTYMPGLSHNGIYIGGGRFVHAASERTGVITTRLDDPYWAPRYVGATRPS